MMEIILLLKYFIVTIVAISISDFLKPYLNNKAKNLATKEDFQQVLNQQKSPRTPSKKLKRRFLKIFGMNRNLLRKELNILFV